LLVGWAAFAAMLVAAVSNAPCGASPQETEAADAPSAQPESEGDRIRFSFDGAPLDQVLRFFERETGLPVVRETDVPDVKLTYHAPESYDLPQALRELNVILQTQGIMLREDGRKLYLQKLTEMVREALPTYRGALPEEVTDDQIVVVVVPLQNALAKPLGEKLSAMVGAYGSVTILDAQNSLVICETAGKIRQLLDIVAELDKEDVEGVIEIFKVEHTKAADLMVPLKALLAEKVQKYVIDQQGQQKLLEEEEIRGLTISHDDRTNSIIAKGIQSKIDQLEEAMELLDVPASAGGRMMRTFALLILSPNEAVEKLNLLYAKLPDADRPTMIRLDDAGKITIIGSESAIAEAEALLLEIDGGGAAEDQPGQATTSRVTTVLRLEHAQPQSVSAVIQQLLNPRQAALVRLIPGPDSHSLIVSGPPGEVATVESLLPILDSPGDLSRDVRMIRLMSEDPQRAYDAALELYEKQRDASDPASLLETMFDPASASVTIIGAPTALDRFAQSLRMVEENYSSARERRPFPLQFARPSDVADTLGSLAEGALQSDRERPEFIPVNDLNLLLVTAAPEQFAIITSLVQAVDRPQAQDMPPLRILQLRTADAANLAATLMSQYALRSSEEKRQKPVTITADASTNALVVAAHPDLLSEIEAVVTDLNRITELGADDREIRIFPLKVARAEDLARVMDEMYPEPEPLFDRLGRPIPGSKPPREVVVRADPQTNSLIVDATSARMAGFETLVEQLDRQQIAEDGEIRTYAVRHADLNAIAGSLQQLKNAGSLGAADRAHTISITTEPVSRTLVISGPSEIFPRIETVLASLDVRPEQPATALRFFRLESARAENIAPMLRDILVARITEEVPDAGATAEALLSVTSDRKTNTLIISAPEALMPVAEELIEQLDQGANAAGASVVRVRPLTFANAAEVSTALTQALPELISSATSEPVDVRLLTSASSNAIILVGLESDLPQVEELIDTLDKQQNLESMAAETYTLEFADAALTAPVLQRLLTNQQATDPRVIAQRLRTSRGQLDFTPQIQVEADARTNSLIVSGTQQVVELARTLVEQLDQPDDRAGRAVATFTPANGKVATLIETVRRVIESTRAGGSGAGGRSTLELIHEPNSGTIVVIGSADESEAALELLEEWDAKSPAPPQIDLKIIALEHSNAATVASAVGPMLRDQSTWPENLHRLLELGVAVAQPNVTADAAANRLLVSAPRELLPVAEALIAQLDQPPHDGAAQDVRIFHLEHAAAAEAAIALQTAMTARAQGNPAEKPASITAAASTNSIIASASPTQMAAIEDLVASLDEGVDPQQPQVRTIFLRHARAENVAPVVQEVLVGGDEIDTSTMPGWMRNQIVFEQMMRGQAQSEVRIAADTRLNAVVISAPAALLDLAEEMVAQLDVDPATVESGPPRRVRVLVLDAASAGELATTLETLFTGENVDAAAPAPAIRVDSASNSLIIRATDEQFAAIEEVVRNVDEASLGAHQEFATIPVDPSRMRAREVADTLKRLLDRGAGSKVEVITIEQLLQRNLEGNLRDTEPQSGENGSDAQENSEGESSESVSFHGSGAGLSLLAVTLFAAADHPQGLCASVVLLQDSEEPGVTIAVDEATNSLVIVGPPRAVERIRALVAQIEAQMPLMPGTVRYVPLPESVVAADIASLLLETLEQVMPAPADAAGPRRGQPPRSRVSVIADEPGNALIIAANDSDFETVAELLIALTRPGPSDRLIVKMYPLERITADRAATSVRDLIGDVPLDPRAAARRGQQTERMRRTIDLQLQAQGRTIDAVLDPARIRVSTDVHTNSLVVMGPADAIEFIDQFVALIDQSSPRMHASLKLFPLRHAQADELSAPVLDVLTARYRALPEAEQRTTIEPAVAIDARTNTLLVTAAPEFLAEVESLLTALDVELGDGRQPLRMITLNHAPPSRAAAVLDEVIIGEDQELRKSTVIVPLDEAAVLLVRASAETSAEIDAVLAEIDRDATREFEVRTITLERASSPSVAQTIQQLYDDRAQIAAAGQGRRAQTRRISIIGDQTSNVVMVAASDEDFETIRGLIEQFDSEVATKKLEFKVYPLEHAKAMDISQQVQELVNSLTWGQGGGVYYDPWFGFMQRGNNQQPRGTIAVTADARLNALIVTGEGDKFEVVAGIVDALDAPATEGATRFVRIYPLKNADLEIARDIVQQAISPMPDDPWMRRWSPPDPSAMVIREEPRTKSLIVAASAAEHERIAAIIEMLDDASIDAEQTITVLPVEFAVAAETAEVLSDFLAQRAEATGAPESTAVIVPSESGNALVISAGEADLATIQDLLSRIDQPQSDNRTISIVALKRGDAADVERILRTVFNPGTAGARPRLFGGPGGTGGGGAQGVQITADARTNSLIINAPRAIFPAVEEMIAALDNPPQSDEMIIRTYELEGANATEVARLLTDTLELDPEGETQGVSITLDELGAEPVFVQGKVIADKRTNSIVVRTNPESIAVFETLIARFDEVEAVNPVEWRIITLEHALVYDVSWTLRTFLRRPAGSTDPEARIDYSEPDNQLFISATPDQFKQIEELLELIDVPREKPVTKFIALEYADAETARDALSYFYGQFAPGADTPDKLATRIVANPAQNSILVSTTADELPSIEALIGEIDREEFDPSLQLRVIALDYADAASVAQAINDAFQAQVQGRGDQPQPQQPQPPRNGEAPQDGERREQPVITQLVEVEDWVRASAEPMTNTVVVSASRQNLAKIERIVEEIDKVEFAQGPPPRLIPVTTGSPEQFAQSLNEVYQSSSGRGPRGQGGGASGGRHSIRIIPNEASSTLIVRAPEEEFLQIQALAEALQAESSIKGLSVHVLKLNAAPAVRVEQAILEAFNAKAQQTQQPLSIKADPLGNTLVIASTASLYEEIEAAVKQLDSLQPAAGQGIFIIELENLDPEAATEMIETIGLNQPQDPESISRLVTEPIRISPLRGRNAVIVIANPADRETIVGILKALDAQPEFGEAQMRIVQLRNASASAIADLIGQMLSPQEQQSQSPIAQAVQEQVRRLSLQRRGQGEPDLALDLTAPIRVIVNDTNNSLLIGSTAGNLDALEEIIRGFDTLAITEAVVVQIFPLENIRAEDFQRIVNDLFTQGSTLGTPPGSEVDGVPGSATGRALSAQVAMTVDERTNTIIVAGSEEAVAFVEVMRTRLDSQTEIGWVEPRIIRLEYANAGDLAETIQAILVEGAQDLPQSTPLQNQVARIRSALGQEDGPQSDLFVPMSRLVVRAEEQMNALVLVGTKGNLDVVEELVKMFDIEELDRTATVRIYPIEHASASRIQATIERLFAQQEQNELLREEDRIIIEADERTNALIVSTSKSSFDLFESLLATLDSEIAPDFAEIRRIAIANSSASRLAPMIQQLMDARLERLTAVEPEAAELEQAVVIADERTNSLLVAASNDSFNVIRTLAEELDAATELVGAGVEVLKLEHSSPERIAEIVNQIMERRYAELPAELRQSQEPLVLVDQRSNSLLIAANPEDVNAIRELVTTLESTQIDPLVSLTVVPLTSKRADDVAPMIERLMEERLSAMGEARGNSDRVAIEPDRASNSLIVSAPPEHLATVRSLVEALEAADPTSYPIEVITLARMQASNIIDVIDEMYVQPENEKRGVDTIRVSADDRLNALVVNAPDSDVTAIRALVERLEGRGGIVQEIQTIPLTAADPLEIVGLLEDVLRGPGLGGRRNADDAVIFKLITEAADEDGVVRQETMDEVEISMAIRESISLVPDRRTNSVIVTAPAESMALIKTLVRSWDQSYENNLNLRIFALEFADAESTAQILADLFRPANTEVLVPVSEDRGFDAGLDEIDPDVVNMQPQPAIGRTELTSVPDERRQLSITVDSRTNSIIVAGTPRYLDLVEQVILELDSKSGNEREQFVYPLKNAVAEDVALVIGEFIAEDQRKLIETLPPDQRGSATRLLEREVTIIGDEKSNSVVVSVSPRYREQVMAMIEQLDVDPPQVLIQVLLAEITIDSGDEWGVRAFAQTDDDGTAIKGGFGLASAFLAGAGIPNLAVVGDDFRLMVRALESQGRLQVLSNPSIMAANNEEAEIQIGETIRVPSNLIPGSVGQGSQVSVEAVDLGVILNVTPTINPDGFVRMTINPEISNLSQRETQLSEDFSSPVITVRRADTTVTVMDGQTIVLGGLLSDRFEIREEAVPFFSDLPIVGALFRSSSEQRAKTELLIVLTPHVITSPTNLPPLRPQTVEEITDEQIDRLSVPEDVKRQMREGQLDRSDVLWDFRSKRLNDAMNEEEVEDDDGIDY
jgi:type II secretory pathway component GspD/PulD (secretin)